MFENEFNIAQLVAAKIKGTISEAQQVELDAWVGASEQNAVQYQEYLDEGSLEEKVKRYYNVDSAAVLRKINEGVKSQNASISIDNHGPQEAGQKGDAEGVKILRLWPRIGIAAAVAFVILAGIWFIERDSAGRSEQEIHYAGDALPGKEGATLTLANGKKIRLSGAANGELAKEAGVSISKAADGQLIYEIESNVESSSANTLSTNNGETYQVKLPDGSKVWLNASSSLTYRTSLIENGFRSVKLTGEAYFEIEKDAEHPFIVESADQEVSVLGTHFNVKAYPDEKNVRTTLLEGSVSIKPLTSSLERSLDPSLRRETTSQSPNEIATISRNDVKLKPGEQAINNGSIKIEKADVQEATAWKDGNTVFKDKPLTEIMRELARWYNITVIYAADAPKNETFSGAVSRARNLSTVLERMQTTGSVRFEIQGKAVKVMR